MYMYFLFNNQHYLQMQGTAMGTCMTPSYANILMASLEQQMLLYSPHNLLPFIWLCFIDHIFMLWTHGSMALTIFLQHINSFHPTIKFSHQQSHVLPSTSLTPQSYSPNKGHYSPHTTSNPPTKNYYSTTPPTT